MSVINDFPLFEKSVLIQLYTPLSLSCPVNLTSLIELSTSAIHSTLHFEQHSEEHRMVPGKKLDRRAVLVCKRLPY